MHGTINNCNVLDKCKKCGNHVQIYEDSNREKYFAACSSCYIRSNKRNKIYQVVCEWNKLQRGNVGRFHKFIVSCRSIIMVFVYSLDDYIRKMNK